MATENIRETQIYYQEANSAYQRWGGETYAIHLGYHEDPRNPTEHFLSLTRLAQKLISLAQIEPDHIVLDAGCGFGNGLAELGKMEVTVHGINICHHQLVDAKHNLEELGLGGKVNISEQDFGFTAFPSQTFDRAIFCESLFHAWDKKRVMEEVSRILKPTGKITIADFFYKKNPPASERAVLDGLEEGWAGRINSLKSMYWIMKRAGLDVSNAIDITKNVMPSMQIAAESAVEHRTDSLKVSSVRQNHRDATINIQKLMQNGLVGYYMIVAAKV